ncbi:MAG: hypothetical protein JW889_15335 [Verrucomicrobia bacterium]|nr:hypothetical protein [Verrucomicrobiota bacterium]
MLQTDDLYLGGFALTRGGELAGVEVRGVNGRRVAFFQIEGPDMEDVQRDYYRGATRVDLRLLKSEVRRLKDIAFGAMREEERRDGAHTRRRDPATQA